MHEPQRTTSGQRRAPADRATPDQNHALPVDGTLRPDHRDPGAPGWPAATGWPVLSDASGAGAPRHIRIEVDRDALVDEVVAYVTAPGSPEHRSRALKELASKRNLWIPRDLLYQMVLAAACAACAGPAAQPRSAAADCPATPLAQAAPPDANMARLTTTWYTDGVLWAGPVPPYRGRWFADAGGMKVGWWRATTGALTIDGRRRDAPAPPLKATIPDGYGDAGFQSTSLAFPTDGCWEITARIAGAGGTHAFRIIAQVQPASAHPLAAPASASSSR
jgi:hypothetical protein